MFGPPGCGEQRLATTGGTEQQDSAPDLFSEPGKQRRLLERKNNLLLDLFLDLVQTHYIREIRRFSAEPVKIDDVCHVRLLDDTQALAIRFRAAG